MFILKKISVIILLISLTACTKDDKDIASIQNMYADQKKTIAAGKLLSSRSICEKTSWSSSEDQLGRVTVKYQCDFIQSIDYISKLREEKITYETEKDQRSIDSYLKKISYTKKELADMTNTTRYIEHIKHTLNSLNEESFLQRNANAIWRALFPSNQSANYIADLLVVKGGLLDLLDAQQKGHYFAIILKSNSTLQGVKNEGIPWRNISDEEDKILSKKVYEIVQKIFNEQLDILAQKDVYLCDDIKEQNTHRCNQIRYIEEEIIGLESKIASYKNKIIKQPEIYESVYPRDMVVIETLEWLVNPKGKIFFKSGAITQVSSTKNRVLMKYTKDTYLDYILKTINYSDIDLYLNDYSLYLFGKIILQPALNSR